MFEKATKTEKERRIALDPYAVELLAEHRDRIARQPSGLRFRRMRSCSLRRPTIQRRCSLAR
jgi:hypothetical protein